MVIERLPSQALGCCAGISNPQASSRLEDIAAPAKALARPGEHGVPRQCVKETVREHRHAC